MGDSVASMLQRIAIRGSVVAELYGLVASFCLDVEGRSRKMAPRVAMRSVQLVVLQVQGCSQPQAAERLGKSERTINEDLKRVRAAIRWNERLGNGRLECPGGSWPVPDDEVVLAELARARAALVVELGDDRANWTVIEL